MARLALVPQDIIGGYPATPLAANAADVVFTNAGASFAEGAGFPHTGREILIIKNANAGAQTITVSSVADDKGRKNDIPAYTLQTGDVVALWFPKPGWSQPDGQLYFAASATDVQFGVVRLPAYPV